MNAHRGFGLNWLAGLVVVLSLGVTASVRAQNQNQDPSQDPPDRIARVSFLRGDVSLQPGSPNGDAGFAAAEINYTLSAGDRLYTGQDGVSELQSDNLALRLGRLSDVTLENFSQEYVQLGLAQGSIRVRSYTLQQNGAIEIDTANGAFTVTQAGDVRVSSYPGYGQRPDTTIVTVNAGQVHAVGNGMDTVIESGQVLRIDGNNPVQAGFVQMLPMDDLDQFDQQRDGQRAAAAQEIRDQYVNPGMVGYDDLAQYGDWGPSPDYGQVWYPRQVDAGWSPYHNGHWAYIAPWGYTWVEAEPWGFAPFHYGRWAQFGGRWGWVPGPPVVRPIYSPALVAFVGGSGFSLSIRVGGGGGVAAWFPLGPREPFVPWYRASPGYVNRVNVSNIYNRNTVEVRNVYVNRTTNVYVNKTTINNVYVNRNVGTVAVPQQAFERGQQVRGAQMRVDARQLQQAQVMTRPPEVAARPAPTVGMAPARALPPVQARSQFQRGPQGQSRGDGGNGSVAQRFGQPVRQAPAVQQQQPQVRPQGQAQVPVAPPTRGEARPVPGVQTPAPVLQGNPTVRPPGAMRPQNPGNNADQPQNQQQRPGQQPNPQQPGSQQPGRTQGGQNLAAPVGGGRNDRPAEQVAPRPSPSAPAPVLQGNPTVRAPGAMRPQNPDQQQNQQQNQQQRPAQQPQVQQQPNAQQPGRTPGGQDLAAPVGGGRNSRPAEDSRPQPSAPAPVNRPAPQAPAARPEQPQRGQPQQQRPPQAQQPQVQPQRQAPSPQTQVRPQQQAPQLQQRQAPPQQARPQVQQQRPAPAPKPEPQKEQPK